MELLQVWELGLSQTPTRRVLTLLSAALPELSFEQLQHLSIGQRDGLLLALRERLFGSQLASLVECPTCGERLELTFRVSDIRATSSAEPETLVLLDVEDYQVQFRLPNSLDLEQVTIGQHNFSTMKQQLLQRCLVSASRDQVEIAIEYLPADVVAAVLKEMSQVDPQAEVQLALICAACQCQWQALFDIASFFWMEIQAFAKGILREVHTLASAYGWREADILAMSPQRRQWYMEMIGQ
jgi:hypothetical protein